MNAMARHTSGNTVDRSRAPSKADRFAPSISILMASTAPTPDFARSWFNGTPVPSCCLAPGRAPRRVAARIALVAARQAEDQALPLPQSA